MAGFGGYKRRGVNPLIRVGGIGQMATSIRKIGDKELSEEMKAASRAAADKIVPFAKAMVPVQTGALKRSITTARSTRRYGRIEAGTPTRVKYARAVHRGRPIPGTGKYTKATKFLSKAIPKAFPHIIDEYIKAMNTIAKRFERRHGVSRVYGRYK